MGWKHLRIGYHVSTGTGALFAGRNGHEWLHCGNKQIECFATNRFDGTRVPKGRIHVSIGEDDDGTEGSCVAGDGMKILLDLSAEHTTLDLSLYKNHNFYTKFAD